MNLRRNYPLNCWWVAAQAQEVTTKPISRWLLEQRVVLFRTEEGVIAALEDRCAHRWAPLSQGQVFGEEIACPYHGFRYNTRGACTHVPVLSHAPAKVHVRYYPVLEHASLVWIWMGHPQKADVALLPDIPWFTDPAFVLQWRGYSEVSCNYMLIQENVLDLTHIPFVHNVDSDSENQMKGWEELLAEINVTDRSVTYTLKLSDVPLAPLLAIGMGIGVGRRINRVDWGTFASPACTFSGFDFEDLTPTSSNRARYSYRSMHCTTPVSPNRCHYWWPAAQDFGHQVPSYAQELSFILERTVKQDRDVLEAIQITIDRDMRGDIASEMLIASDRAPVAARRILEKMLEAESP